MRTTNGNCAMDKIQILQAGSGRAHATDAICMLNKDNTDVDIEDIIEEGNELPGVETLSRHVEDVNAHMAGFIVFRLCAKKRNICKQCRPHLISGTSTSMLTARKNRECLKNASPDAIRITATAEKLLRSHSHLLHVKTLIQILCKKTYLAVANDVFNSEEMTSHILEQRLFNDHKTKLIDVIAKIYLEIRIHHECRKTNQRAVYVRSNNLKHLPYNPTYE